MENIKRFIIHLRFKLPISGNRSYDWGNTWRWRRCCLCIRYVQWLYTNLSSNYVIWDFCISRSASASFLWSVRAKCHTGNNCLCIMYRWWWNELRSIWGLKCKYLPINNFTQGKEQSFFLYIFCKYLLLRIGISFFIHILWIQYNTLVFGWCVDGLVTINRHIGCKLWNI